MSTGTQLYTWQDLLAMPDDGVERWIIDGELFEGDHETNRRNRRHSRLMARISQIIQNWLDQQVDPRGEVVAGEAGFRLCDEPDTTVGVDVGYVSPETAAANSDDVALFDGAPVLAVEILSPSDVQKNVAKKVTTYLKHGVKSVWIVDPDFDSITIHTPDAEPVLFNKTHTIPNVPGMPGFQPTVAAIFS